MGKIRLLALMLLFVIIMLASCGDVDDTQATETTTTTGASQTTETTEPPVTIQVAGKSYKADVTTVNIAWDDLADEPTQYNQETFVAWLKTHFGESVITFTDESSFILSGTKSGLYDMAVDGCERMYNELFKTIPKRGNVDVVVEDGKLSFLSDIFLSGWGMYFSIDYVLIEE